MTYQDPNADVTETRTYDPVSGVTEVRRTEVRNGGGAAWWIAGAVAAVAIGAVAFMVASQSTPTTPDPQAVAAAADQGRAEGYAQGAQTAAALAQSNAQSAQVAQTTAQINAQSEADRAAAARARAELAADRAAMSAQSSAQDASAIAAPRSSGIL